ncbi:MAG TPA: sigma 54-interacting transcriptional regulator [Kofleriaceae bacterium]|nr:sigma 54-interacting transcriptional regulator [Kofleriaceae bacterium]
MRKHTEDARSQATSTDIGPALASAGVDTRVFGLTILYHPSLDRIGERALLTGLESGRTFELSRLDPLFVAPGGRDGRPLADHRISRAPLSIRGAGGAGDRAVELVCGDSRTPVEADGHPIAGSARFSRAELERGVVLLLARRVVLLLHLLDPVTDAGEPALGIIGYSAAVVRVRRDIRKVADVSVPVLIRGESGTGKELVARAIHDAGARRDRPYLAVNLGAVPQALAASELFGVVRGAFTGANQDRPGYFQRAQGGTIFLDEIGEAAPELQVLLLRCLESGEIQPVGADRPRHVDVRVVAATDADLAAAVEAARFRAPLLYRLGGFVIRIPPLRERREDLGRLLAAFLRRELAAVGEAAVLDDAPEPWLPAPVVARLAQYDWPGNVRQLANLVRHLVIANRGARPAAHFQALDELSPRGNAAPASAAPPSAAAVPAPVAGPPPAAAGPPPAQRPADITDEQLVAALRAHRFSPERAATALGIPRASIYRLMDRSPRVRKASELGADEIRAAQAAANGDEELMAVRLEVSVRALRRRMGELARRT